MLKNSLETSEWPSVWVYFWTLVQLSLHLRPCPLHSVQSPFVQLASQLWQRILWVLKSPSCLGPCSQLVSTTKSFWSIPGGAPAYGSHATGWGPLLGSCCPRSPLVTSLFMPHPHHSLTQLYEAAGFLSQWMTPPLPAKNGVHTCLVFLTGPASSSFPEDTQWTFPNCLLPHVVGQALIICYTGITAGLLTMGSSKDV